jgi:8-oxo-dGTP pyrophosphatase MutT (NUDIX family)
LLGKIGAKIIFSTFLACKALLSPVAFGVAALVLDSRGRVLLVRQSYMRGWRLPGGGVDRGEAPASAVLRELSEEVGLTSAALPEFFGLYVRRGGWVTNVIALYVLRDIELDFRPNWEVREILFADPAAPPADSASATLRRLAEWRAGGMRAPYW